MIVVAKSYPRTVVKRPSTAKSLASHVIFNCAKRSGCTRRVALASICSDSMKVKSALSFQFRSKFDLGDKLVCPTLASVSFTCLTVSTCRAMWDKSMVIIHHSEISSQCSLLFGFDEIYNRVDSAR